MRNTILSGFILFIASISCSNYHEAPDDSTYFEGVITYKGSFVRKTARYDSLMLTHLAGDINTLYVKEGNYLTMIGNGITTRLLYRKDENKTYRERFNAILFSGRIANA